MQFYLCVYYNFYECLCVYFNLYVYTTISMCTLQSLCVHYNLYVYTTISMYTIQSLGVHYNLFVYPTISMCTLHSLCVLYNFYKHTTICIQQSLWILPGCKSAVGGNGGGVTVAGRDKGAADLLAWSNVARSCKKVYKVLMKKHRANSALLNCDVFKNSFHFLLITFILRIYFFNLKPE